MHTHMDSRSLSSGQATDRSPNQLTIAEVSKTYRNGVKALDAISLSLGNGMFGLLGPNGAGKSTLMRSLATLQSVDSGQLLFNGIEIQSEPESLRPHLGYLPQDFGVYPGVSALQLLDYLALLKGVTDKGSRRRQIEQLLQRTHLYAHRHEAVSDFSGGMRQRFGIAQALLGAPRLLIVDEPTAGLDPLERNSFHQLLCGLAERMVVLLSTHIVEDVRNLCPRLGVLSQGRLRYVGTPQALIDCLQGKLWTRSDQPGSEASATAGHRVLSVRIIGGRCQQRVYAESRPGPDFEAAEPDLEDGYFHALGAGVESSVGTEAPPPSERPALAPACGAGG